MITALFYVFLAIFAATAVVTLLGVTKILSIEDKYLKVLLGAFLLELAISVVGVYRSADFFGTSAADFIEALPSSVRSDSVDVVAQNITAVVDEREQYRSEVNELQEQVTRMSDDIDRYSELENNTFLLFARLSADINRHGEFINLTYRPQEKRDEATRICDALQVVYGATGCADSNPLAVSQRLSAYQRAWQFQTTAGHFGQQTLVAIINEYLLLARQG